MRVSKTIEDLSPEKRDILEKRERIKEKRIQVSQSMTTPNKPVTWGDLKDVLMAVGLWEI